jgi:hypothetical protein
MWRWTAFFRVRSDVRPNLTCGSNHVSTRLAGCSPCGVLSEICTEDMTGMMRVPELKLFSAKHGLVMTSVSGHFGTHPRHFQCFSFRLHHSFHFISFPLVPLCLSPPQTHPLALDGQSLIFKSLRRYTISYCTGKRLASKVAATWRSRMGSFTSTGRWALATLLAVGTRHIGGNLVRRTTLWRILGRGFAVLCF